MPLGLAGEKNTFIRAWSMLFSPMTDPAPG